MSEPYRLICEQTITSNEVGEMISEVREQMKRQPSAVSLTDSKKKRWDVLRGFMSRKKGEVEFE